jgi:Flp pilus assembly protein TadB
MNRSIAFLFTTLVVALTALAWGTATGAEQDSSAAGQAKSAHAIRASDAPPNATDADRARALKAAAQKRRQDAQKRLQELLDAQQAAPGSAGKGVEK